MERGRPIEREGRERGRSGERGRGEKERGVRGGGSRVSAGIERNCRQFGSRVEAQSLSWSARIVAKLRDETLATHLPTLSPCILCGISREKETKLQTCEMGDGYFTLPLSHLFSLTHITFLPFVTLDRNKPFSVSHFFRLVNN